jgi:hypothetical protein
LEAEAEAVLEALQSQLEVDKEEGEGEPQFDMLQD